MKQSIIKLFDQFTHGTMNRRTFLTRLRAMAGGAAAAYALLPMLENNYALAEKVPADDPSIVMRWIEYPGPTGDIGGYLAKPADAEGPLPAVLVIHENRGLNPHIEDVARRFGKAGYLALAVDMLSPLGGTPDDSEKARDMIYALEKDETIAGLVAGIDYLKGHVEGNGKVGAVGFCWGGGMVNAIAVASANLDAGVAYYGRQPEAEEVARIKAALMLHYGGLDERINAGIPAFEEALRKNGVDYRLFVYEGANHAFNNDTNAARYNPEVADIAWQRTLEFFAAHLH